MSNVLDILSLNIARRHLNKGQIAIVVAKAYPEVAEPGRGKKGLVSKTFPMVNEGALSQARTHRSQPDSTPR
jgi:hypothetical protein